jgi:hypothetical protein
MAAWMGYRLYPYVPTIDLHNYWCALKPVILFPTLTLADLCRHTTIWVTIFVLAAAAVGQGRLAMIPPLFCECILAARVLIVGTVLSVAKLLALSSPSVFGRSCLLCPRGGVARVCLCCWFGSLVIFERLQPFQFQSEARQIGWLQFWSLMQGPVGVDVMSFFERSFLYGRASCEIASARVLQLARQPPVFVR